MPELNNDKNVYLLGAGFSKEIGLPLQDDFLLVAKEVFFRNPTLFSHFERVFEYQDKLTKMKKYLNYPLLNLEHLFNLIEMNIFYSGNNEPEQIKIDFTKLVCDVLIDKTPCPFGHDQEGHLCVDDSYQQYLSFISLLVNNYQHNIGFHNDTVISFNYDLVLEGAACIYNWKRQRVAQTRRSRSGSNLIQFNIMFGKENILVDPVSQCFTMNRPTAFFPVMDIFSEQNNSIKLLKLHGSINWKTTDNNKTFIVPPTWNKSDPQVRRLWEIAYNELMTARRIIVIGYSFPETDIYVKSLLALALNDNKQLQNIYFINPDKDVAKRTSLSLLDKYFEKYCDYKEWKFSEFIGSVDGKKFIRDKLNRDVTA